MQLKIPDSIPAFINWYIQNSVEFGHKAGLIVLTIGLALVVDNLTGFTFYYQNKQRIEQVALLRTLKEKPGIDSLQLSKLTILQNEILDKKDFRYNYYRFLGSSFTNNATIKANIKNNINSAIIKNGFTINLKYHLLSSSYLLIFMLFMLPFMSIWGMNDDIAARLIFFIFSLISISLAIALNSFLMWAFIPIFKWAWTQYLFNILAHSITFGVLFKLQNDKKIEPPSGVEQKKEQDEKNE